MHLKKIITVLSSFGAPRISRVVRTYATTTHRTIFNKLESFDTFLFPFSQMFGEDWLPAAKVHPWIGMRAVLPRTLMVNLSCFLPQLNSAHLADQISAQKHLPVTGKRKQHNGTHVLLNAGEVACSRRLHWISADCFREKRLFHETKSLERKEKIYFLTSMNSTMHGQIALMFRFVRAVVAFEYFCSGPMLPFHMSL